MKPFRWDEVRRAQFRAELDVYYTRLYGLTRDELRYSPYGVHPKEVHGEDFPGETFLLIDIRTYVLLQSLACLSGASCCR